MNINWKRKLTSRKFWAAVIGFISAMLTALGAGELTQNQIIAVVAAVSVLIAYIVGEGMVDSAHVGSDNTGEKEPE